VQIELGGDMQYTYDAGGNINVLGGGIIGQCEKKSSYIYLSNSEKTETQLFESTIFYTKLINLLAPEFYI
jgi:hypothetical protein